ncbi:vWA domain-containing protein [Halarcobacter bivalviorum]|uniref:VWA domain-containing protein n=1 Tax=Halarcobacter bivalviorum TaxID=663364 RepID=A0AAX2A7G3_9BACT|nr:VWA domain-containing protein [Halarcobacter bivalviorum]AXH11623.1 von Willebrand factor type A (vWA) domain-containing protein (BatA domain), putative oxygen tolerance protein BatA [Halarcobacter bivalviorum]RXK08948.1 VWA domain-containing protein [Halarcobacter bivalviorum]
MFNYLLSIRFEYPYLLVLILLFVICSLYCKAKIPTYIVPHLTIFSKTHTNTSAMQTLLKALVILGTIFALASPYRNFDTQIIKNDGIDIVLSLDTSGSMNELGFNPLNPMETRFTVVKDIVKEFIPKRVKDNISIVVFGSSVMMATPLSFDKDAQLEIIDYLDVGIVGDKTALIDSLVSSTNILKSSKAKSKVIILLSDGADNASTIPLEIALKLLKKYSIKVYTISIANSNKIILNQIAMQTEGKSFSANSKNKLNEIYEEINKLEKSEIDNNKLTFKSYLFFYPLFLAIISLIILIYLKNRE